MKKGTGGHITISDVAKLANTSIATVSYVLNDSKERYISDELRERVLQAASELNYIKSGLASSLKGMERGVIAVLTPQFQNHFFTSMFVAIEKITNQYGYLLCTCNSFDDIDREKEVIERMIRLRVDGYLIVPTVGGAENTKYIREHKLPFVSLERTLDVDEGYDLVSCGNKQAGYEITKHLIEMGHEKIGLVIWDTEISNLKDRHAGYQAALEEFYIPYSSNYVFRGDITHEDGAQLTRQLLDSTDVTAVIYAQYMMAEGGIKYLQANHVRIPDELSVALIGAPPWTEMNEVSFTRVLQPGEEMGEAAAKILLGRIHGEIPKAQHIQQILACPIIYGDSIRKL